MSGGAAPVAVVNEPSRDGKNRRARAAQLTIASAGVAVLAIAGVYAFVTWPRVPALGPVADLPSAYGPWIDGEFVSPGDQMWVDMNTALREKDREGFLSWATDDAVDQLGQWWDNTSAIGWDLAAITPMDLPSEEDDDENTQLVFLGTQFAFAAQPARGSGDGDAGLQLLQGFVYTVTFEPREEVSSFDRYSDDGATVDAPPPEPKIVSITPTFEPNPWDEGPLYAAKRDHVVLFGMADERELVDREADIAEQGAVIALETIEQMGGAVPQEGFVSAITADPERFTRWRYGTQTPWEMDVAGYARPTWRPQFSERWLDPTIATGLDTSGTLVVMGPESADQREQTFVHEFAHALHHTAAPGSFTNPPAAVMEGFARYVEWTAGVSEPQYTYPQVKQLIAERGADAFSDEMLRGQDAGLAYAAAGSYYAFAAAKGEPVWDMAIYGRSGYGGLVGWSELRQGVSIPEWQAWVAAQ